MFPLVIIAQRNAAKMNNYMPQLQIIQMKMTEARQQGNVIEAARYSQEQMIFMREKGLNPLKNMLVPFAQVIKFSSSNLFYNKAKEGDNIFKDQLSILQVFILMFRHKDDILFYKLFGRQL